LLRRHGWIQALPPESPPAAAPPVTSLGSGSHATSLA
jgi:hypothetical protein